jgi:hypothetical protein
MTFGLCVNLWVPMCPSKAKVPEPLTSRAQVHHASNPRHYWLLATSGAIWPKLAKSLKFQTARFGSRGSGVRISPPDHYVQEAK